MQLAILATAIRATSFIRVGAPNHKLDDFSAAEHHYA